MKLPATPNIDFTRSAGPRLRCFLAKALPVIFVITVLSQVSRATQLEMPAPYHLWRVHGVFVDAKGKPLENIEVKLMRDGVERYKTTTDRAGRFGFDHIYGRYTLHIDKAGYSSLSREVMVGLETVTLLRRNALYVIAGPGACADDCSTVFTSKGAFDRAIRRNTEHHNQEEVNEM